MYNYATNSAPTQVSRCPDGDADVAGPGPSTVEPASLVPCKKTSKLQLCSHQPTISQ